jgi:hypothetical protein
VIDVNKIIRARCRVKILIEDKRMGGDLSEIRAAGRHMIEVWKALGMDLDGVEFLWSSEEISKRAHLYWPMVMGLARETKVVRLARYYLWSQLIDACAGVTTCMCRLPPRRLNPIGGSTCLAIYITCTPSDLF